ncbi:hypothetical protein NDU88_006082 [Pleurodeles waltl]|uniref:Uncharacterized protein n=1 Tax=Pleurodeles waltl TaxID=8319 RepID=A0AAV7LRD9_PLEWA|nr:hypothetical protein NDU88_006082 [Pleurodeles waltl]
MHRLQIANSGAQILKSEAVVLLLIPLFRPGSCQTVAGVGDTPLHSGSPVDKEKYPRGALQSADVTSVDINPEVKKEIESKEWAALCEEEAAMPKEPDRTESTTSTGERRKEPTTWTPQGRHLSFSDRTGVRASHVAGGTWLMTGPTTERRTSQRPLQTKREGNSKEIADPEKGKEEKRIEKKKKKRRD